MLEYAQDRPWPGVTTWSDAESRQALAALASSVEDLTGYQVACINIVHQGVLRAVAVNGSPEQRDLLMDSQTSVDSLEAEFAVGESLGRFVFVAAERAATERDWGVTFEVDTLSGTQAWHPEDLLAAPVRDEVGRMVGLVCVDVPADRRRADAATRVRLERYAAIVEPVILMALRRDRDEERARLSRAAHQVIAATMREQSAMREQSTTRAQSTQAMFGAALGALAAGFATNGVWLHTFENDGAAGVVHGVGGSVRRPPPRLVATSVALSQRAWNAGEVQLLCAATGEHHPPIGDLDIDIDVVLADMAHIATGSILVVPVGGQDCLGSLILARPVNGARWSEAEITAALDIGRDLGLAIVNTRALEREQRAVLELQALDSYKSQLVATLSHELKTPLTSILGNVELIENGLGSEDLTRSLAAVSRGSRRLVTLVQDLMLLATVGDAGRPLVTRPVDLGALVRDTVELTAVTAQHAQVSVEVSEPAEPVVAVGDVDELERVISNLVTNAYKYTPAGGRVRLDVRQDGDEAVFSCLDTGIGIAEGDQKRLFDEFFRSADPAAQGRPGTGLGLTIADRIVRRHGGRLEVESDLDVGTRFEVRLPGPGPDSARLGTARLDTASLHAASREAASREIAETSVAAVVGRPSDPR